MSAGTTNTNGFGCSGLIGTCFLYGILFGALGWFSGGLVFHVFFPHEQRLYEQVGFFLACGGVACGALLGIILPVTITLYIRLGKLRAATTSLIAQLKDARFASASLDTRLQVVETKLGINSDDRPS
jgi:hypothetical protein